MRHDAITLFCPANSRDTARNQVEIHRRHERMSGVEFEVMKSVTEVRSGKGALAPRYRFIEKD